MGIADAAGVPRTAADIADTADIVNSECRIRNSEYSQSIAGTVSVVSIAEIIDTARSADIADIADTARAADIADSTDTAGIASIADSTDTAGIACIACIPNSEFRIPNSPPLFVF